MKLRSEKKLEISKELRYEFLKKIFGFTLFVLIASGFKFNFLACFIIGIILSGYIFITDSLFVILTRLLDKLYSKYLKDIFNGIRKAKEKIQNE